VNDTLTLLREQRFLERLRERDPSLWSSDPAEQEKIRNRLGWLTVHELMAGRLQEISAFAREVAECGYTHAVLLGMGGSSLAPGVFQRTFGSAPGCPQLIVVDTTDPTTILQTDRSLKLKQTLFIVSSKSGSTIETQSLYRYFAARVRGERGNNDALEDFVAITDPGTGLARQAEDDGFWRCFLNPVDIGGRYSALSYFGLVPAAAVGVDIASLLDRAARADWESALELGAALANHAASGRNKVTFVPGAGLESFGAWTEQLLAESTGKRGKGLIPVDGEPPGDPSVYAGDRVFVSLCIAGARDDVWLHSLEAAGHPVIRIDLADRLDIGAEFLRWEVATAAAGAALGVNPFDEPNVQESKDNTGEMLREAERAGRLPEPEPIVVEDCFSLFCEPEIVRSFSGQGESSPGAMAAALFAAGNSGDYAAIMAYIPQNGRTNAQLTRLRVAIRDTTRLATTVGYGPRYLHSTGQLHKGGPNSGLFLQITCDDPEDTYIPGAGYGFSTLKQAQALGDLRALQDRGKRVMRVHLKGQVEPALERLVDSISAHMQKVASAGR
jgi:glucose-6-phosphate isomerase